MGPSTLAERFQSHRRHLIAVGYRVTGSIVDAEDAVQESWLRLSAADAESIDDLRGWLTTVVGRICLDRLKSAAVRRESYVGQWLPEPVVSPWGTAPLDPLDVLAADEDTRLAALVVLDTLTPSQRVAFVLHDGFAVPFDVVAEILDVAPATARQLASRARKQFGTTPEPVADPEHEAAVTALMTAMASGDLARVVAALHPDCRIVGDSGGTTSTALRVVTGPQKSARFLLGLLRKFGPELAASMRPVAVNGQLGLYSTGVAGNRSSPPRVNGFTVRDGLVWASYDFANPAKLRGVTSLQEIPTEPDMRPPS
ncbi:MAG: sigma-70 family RNA polymerase sigma factor [Rhodococcus sp. (in: high G+C Gram-positive bacteria)]